MYNLGVTISEEIIRKESTHFESEFLEKAFIVLIIQRYSHSNYV